MELPVYQPLNEERSIQLRRYRDALAISGVAVIAFSLWDIIKIFVSLFLGEDTLAGLVSSAMEDLDLPDPGDQKLAGLVIWTICLVTTILICAGIFLYHLYIGMNACREGRQTAKRRKKAYLVLTALSVLASGSIFFPNLFALFQANDEVEKIGLGTLLLELTSLLNYMYILYAVYRIRKLEKEGVL